MEMRKELKRHQRKEEINVLVAVLREGFGERRGRGQEESEDVDGIKMNMISLWELMTVVLIVGNGGTGNGNLS